MDATNERDVDLVREQVRKSWLDLLNAQNEQGQLCREWAADTLALFTAHLIAVIERIDLAELNTEPGEGRGGDDGLEMA